MKGRTQLFRLCGITKPLDNPRQVALRRRPCKFETYFQGEVSERPYVFAQPGVVKTYPK